MHWSSALIVTVVATVATHAVVAGAAFVQSVHRDLPWAEALRGVTQDPLNLGLAQAAGFGAALWLGTALWSRGRPARASLRWWPVRPKVLALAVVAGLALQFPLAELSNLLRELDPMSTSEQVRLRRLLTADGIVDGFSIVFAVVLVAPLAEETVFRGFLLAGLAERYGARVAVVVSSLLFGLSHVDPVTVGYAVVAGLLLGMVALRTGSVFPPLAVHGAINAVPVLLPETVVSIRGFNTIGEDVYHLPIPLLAGTGLVAAAALAVLVRLSDEEPQ